MNDPVRLLVAGAGGFGREHLRMLSQARDVDVVGIADLDAGATEAAARDFGIPHTGSDVTAMTDRLRPDGLIVATPGPTHVQIAQHALALDIPVLVEKPVAMTAGDASLLMAAEKASQGFVLPGHVLRFSAPHRHFVEIVRSNEIGAVLSVTARRHRDDDHARRYAEDPVLMTMIHDIDLALWITGAAVVPDKVAASRRPAGSSRSETLATMSSEAGPTWRLATAWTFPAGSCPSDRIEVVGERGSAELDVDGTIRVFGANPREIDVAVDYDAALAAEHACFVACLRDGLSPTAVTLAEAISGLSIAEAVLKSLDTIRTEKI